MDLFTTHLVQQQQQKEEGQLGQQQQEQQQEQQQRQQQGLHHREQQQWEEGRQEQEFQQQEQQQREEQQQDQCCPSSRVCIILGALGITWQVGISPNTNVLLFMLCHSKMYHKPRPSCCYQNRAEYGLCSAQMCKSIVWVYMYDVHRSYAYRDIPCSDGLHCDGLRRFPNLLNKPFLKPAMAAFASVGMMLNPCNWQNGTRLACH